MKDIAVYWVVIIGGIALFCLLMPAALVKPSVLFESTVGFKGMWPIFLGVVTLQAIVTADAFMLKGRGVSALLHFFYRYRALLGKALFGILFLTATFVLFNWTLQNSLYDLSSIPFDAKTKDTFTTENSYIARFLVEFVPLVFSLTPLTLFLLLFFWLRSVFVSDAVSLRELFPLTLSAFILIFYLAVIHEGLLVTTRYSIILFPLALTLCAYILRSLFPGDGKDNFVSRGERWSLLLFSFLLGIFGIVFAGMSLYRSWPKERVLAFKQSMNENALQAFGLAIILLGAGVILGYGIDWVLRRPLVRTLALSLISILLIGISLVSLVRISPHFFVYASDLLPKNYIISGAWGYGGYEVAEYLNKKPNARELTLWSDAHGVCEFFVGRCIHKQKVDVSKYKIDYLYRSYAGQLGAKFPHNTDEVEWNYVIDGRTKNYMRLYDNHYLPPQPLENP